MREAETLPELSLVAVSETSSSTCSNDTPTASAAIWAITVCAPCPTSAPAWCTITLSISAPPWSSTVAQHSSTKPKEKPTFLKAQAKPRPRLRCASCAGTSLKFSGWSWPEKRTQPPFDWRQPAAWAQLSTTWGIETPLGMGVPTDIRLPSRRMLRMRSSTESISSASASRLIWDSAAKAPCGPPNPRKAPPGMLLV